MRLFQVLMVVLVTAVLSTETQAGLFRHRRVCTLSSCQVTVQSKTAVQKDTAVQKSAVQKEAEPIPALPLAVQKSAAQKTTVTVQSNSLYAICLRKAQIQARRGGRCFHPGGSFGGCHYEGVGYSSRSAAEALNNCCYTGQRRLAASAVVRGRGGWYATKLFW